MKKVLVVSTLAGFLGFERNDIKILKEMGYEVHCATNLSGATRKIEGIEMVRHHIDFSRSPLCKGNMKAYVQLMKLMKEEQFELVHCHTPVGGIIARLCAQKYRKKGKLKVIYTAHGFHFFKGAPIKNWLLFFPLEWICSWWTDVLVTINKEDYYCAKQKMHSKSVRYIPGVGLDVNYYRKYEIDKEKKKKELSIPLNNFVILSVGELAYRKNQRVIIEALHKMNNKNITYLMVGNGSLRDEYVDLINKYGLNENIKLLGYRKDIVELCKVADVFIHPSVREGLGIAPLEAMASGLPLIGSYVNGMKDYVQDMKTGIALKKPTDVDEMVHAINYVMNEHSFCEHVSEYNKNRVLEFDIKNTEHIMKEIYEHI